MKEYLCVARDSRRTSLHEQEMLAELLNKYAKEGWSLVQIIQEGEIRQTVVFERDTPVWFGPC